MSLMRASLATLVLLAATVPMACQHIAARPLSPEHEAHLLAARSLESRDLRRFLETVREAPIPTWPLPRWDLGSLTLAALYFHPDLDVARAHAALVGAAVETAAARPNPTLSLTPELSANPGTAVSPWLMATQLDWPIETAGKRAYRIRRAEATAAAAGHALVTEAWRLRRQLATTLVALGAARERHASLAREVTAATRLVDLLEQRVAAGAASDANVAPIRLALLQATADLAAAETQVADLVAQLAASLGVGSVALAGVEIDPPSAADLQPLLELAADEASRCALLTRSDVLGVLAEYAAAEAELRLQIARQYPDIHIGNGYQFDQGQHKWALGVGLELPILTRNEGPIAEAVAARDEVAARFVATQAHALADVEQAIARRDGAAAQARRLHAAAAERAQNRQRVASALRFGATDRLAELAAKIEELRATRVAREADATLQQALFDLEVAVQGPLGTPHALEGWRPESAKGPRS
jgi:cobalt-zinc-cadmium efflux system outer membrane protein